MKSFNSLNEISEVKFNDYDPYGNDVKWWNFGLSRNHYAPKALPMGKVKVNNDFDTYLYAFANKDRVELFRTSKFRVWESKDSQKVEEMQNTSIENFLYRVFSKRVKEIGISFGSNVVSGTWDFYDSPIVLKAEKNCLEIFDQRRWLIYRFEGSGTFGGHATVECEIFIPEDSDLDGIDTLKNYFENKKLLESPIGDILTLETSKDVSHEICESMGWDY